MPNRYQDIYPQSPLLNSAELNNIKAKDLLTLEFFEAEPAEMPNQVFDQHHILINLRKQPHRVENWRNDIHRDFIYHKNEIVVTPAGTKSGWKWHATSKVIVITLEPHKLEQFAHQEVGILLDYLQLKDIPQFIDEDLTQAAVMLMDALNSDIGSAVMFESLARVFVVKLIQKYGLKPADDVHFNKRYTATHHRHVLDYIATHFGHEITIDTLATQAGLSTAHFSRLFRQTLGQSPHQFVMTYRVEQATTMLTDVNKPMIDIALCCGFSDQAHFSRVFKTLKGQTPKQWRSMHIDS